MLGLKYLITKHSQPSTPANVQCRFTWNDGGETRVSSITGFMDYTGKSMPRGQYLQADSARWVHESQFVAWVQ